MALLGPNGAGKSTLIRILGTTVLPDRGRVRIDGVDVVADPVRARQRCGLMLGDERSWYWRISGRRNLEFFAALHGFRRRPARARTSELLELFGLSEAADRPFGGYSAGMRARLSLARALLSEPPVLLLDEPTRSLDPIASADFRHLVLDLARERGVGALFATHDLHEAAEVASRTVSLSEGRIAFAIEGEATSLELEEALLAAANHHPLRADRSTALPGVSA